MAVEENVLLCFTITNYNVPCPSAAAFALSFGYRLFSHTTPFVRTRAARALETVHLQLLRLREPGLRQKLTDILPLVTLQL